MRIAEKRQHEIQIVTLMIDLYCRYHDDIHQMEILDYATQRIMKCPMMEKKTFCNQCPIHCYEKNMQEKIRKIMRYSGPRMILYHPLLAIQHTLKNRRTK